MRLRKLLIILFVFLVVGFLSYKIISTIYNKADAEQRIVKLPPFTFFKLRGNVFNNDSLPSGKSTVVIYFNSDCEHCQYETQQLKSNVNELQPIANVLLVSPQSVKDLLHLLIVCPNHS
ncbi:MAG: hypothetical protein ACK5NK_02390 [Niabella sp.]